MAIAWVNNTLRFGQPVTRADESGASTGASVQLPSQHALFLREFVKELCDSVPQVERILVRDQTDYVSIYVLCSGDLDEFEDQVYTVEAGVLGRFPGILPEFL
jgi:hypothetical protein